MVKVMQRRFFERGCRVLISTRNNPHFQTKSFKSLHVTDSYVQLHSLLTSHCNCRSFSSLSEGEKVLFQRENGKYGLMRSGIGISSLNTAYWICRTALCLPTLNPAITPGDTFYVDPKVGLGMIACSVAIQGIIMLYPRKLLSKITWKPESQEVLLYTHRLPFVLPASKPSRRAPLGMFALDPTSRNSKVLIDTFDGDFQRYKGSLAIHEKENKTGDDSYKWPPFTLQINSAVDVPQPELLFDVLINPQKVKNAAQRQQLGSHDDDDEEEDDLYYTHTPRRRSYARRKSPVKRNRRLR